MTISLKQLISISPLLILVFTSIFLLLSISYKRNHFFVFCMTMFSFFISMCTLYFINKIIPIDITILFHIDKYSIFYIGLILFSSFCSCFFSYVWLKKLTYNCEELYLLLLFSTIGCISLLMANHLSVLFISIELISLPIVGLIAYSFLMKRSLESAIKYFILSGVISVLMLFGIAIIYAISGNLAFFSLIYELVLMKLHLNVALLFGVALIIFALFFKLSLFPFHVWAPDVYQGMSSELLIFFSATVKVAIFSVLFKLVSIILSFDVTYLNIILIIVSIVSIFFGNFMAIFQFSIKRLLGYSSIAQLGYLLIALIVFDNKQFSLEVIGIYLISYILSSIGIFGTISLMSSITTNFNLDKMTSYRSLFWNNPRIAILMTIMFMSLSGIPVSIGFIGKFYLIFSMLKENFILLGILVVVGMMIGAYAYLRFFSCFYYTLDDVNRNDQYHLISSDRVEIKILTIFLYIISILIVMLGIFPQILTNLLIISKPVWN